MYNEFVHIASQSLNKFTLSGTQMKFISFLSYFLIYLVQAPFSCKHYFERYILHPCVRSQSILFTVCLELIVTLLGMLLHALAISMRQQATNVQIIAFEFW